MKGAVIPDGGTDSEVKEKQVGSSEKQVDKVTNMGKGNLNITEAKKREDVTVLSQGMNNLAISDGDDIANLLRKMNLTENNDLTPRKEKIPVEDEEESDGEENEVERKLRPQPIKAEPELKFLDGKEEYVIPKAPIGGVPAIYNNCFDSGSQITEILNDVDPGGKFRRPNVPREDIDQCFNTPVSNTFNFSGIGVNGNFSGLQQPIVTTATTHPSQTYSELSMRHCNGGIMQCRRPVVPVASHSDFGSESSNGSTIDDQFDSDNINELLQSLSSPGSAYSEYSDATSPASQGSVFGPHSPPYPDEDGTLYEPPIQLKGPQSHVDESPFSEIVDLLASDNIAAAEKLSEQLPIHDDKLDVEGILGPENFAKICKLLSANGNEKPAPNIVEPQMNIVSEEFLQPDLFSNEMAINLEELIKSAGLDVDSLQESLIESSMSNVMASNTLSDMIPPSCRPSAPTGQNAPKRKLAGANQRPVQYFPTQPNPQSPKNPQPQYQLQNQYQQQNPHPRQLNLQTTPQTAPQTTLQTTPQTGQQTYTQSIPVANVSLPNFSTLPNHQGQPMYTAPSSRQSVPISSSVQPQVSPVVSTTSANFNIPVYDQLPNATTRNSNSLTTIMTPGITVAGPLSNIGPVGTSGDARPPIVVLVTTSPGGTTSVSQPITIQTMPPAPTVPLPFIIRPRTGALPKKPVPILPYPPERKTEVTRPPPPAKLELLEEDKVGTIKLDKVRAIPAMRWIQGIRDTGKIYSQDEDGDTLCHNCAVKGEFYCAWALLLRVKGEQSREKYLEYINKGNNRGQTALYQATAINCPDIVQLLINEGADPNCPSWRQHLGEKQHLTALHVAATQGEPYLKTLKCLLASPLIHKDEVNSEGSTALYCAAKAHRKLDRDSKKIDSTKTIQLLLRHGADIYKQDGKTGQTILHAIVETRDVILLKTIIEMLPTAILSQALQKTSFQGDTCLHIAALLPSTMPEDQHTQRQILEILLQHGVDTSIKNLQMKTAKDLLRNQDPALLHRMKPAAKRRTN